ncbi:MAG: aminotransferase class IV [Lentisphaeria bacterium]|nr:aminotransferase class IV [Candidatus Neomarinimicrobiota bacterium]MCF7843046.1 aminotransferase class IV [Lentisphaeria bacterium]
MQIYINGQWIPEAEAVIPFQDGGFLYGDSLFETIRVSAGKPFRLDKHLDRLWAGLKIIRLETPWLQTEMVELCETFIAKNAIQDGLLRLIITRGTILGSPWNFTGTPNRYLTGRAISPTPDPPVLVEFVNESDYPIARFYPAIKSGNYLGNLLAKRDVEQRGVFEPIFVNRDGFITEGAIRNVFFIRNDTLFTPALTLGVLPGVIRDTIIELARDAGIPVEEAHIHKDEIDTFEEGFISSTGVGILPAKWRGMASGSAYTITHQLRGKLNQRLKEGQ